MTYSTPRSHQKRLREQPNVIERELMAQIQPRLSNHRIDTLANKISILIVHPFNLDREKYKGTRTEREWEHLKAELLEDFSLGEMLSVLQTVQGFEQPKSWVLDEDREDV